MVGAFKPKMLRLTAKYADWWNVSSTGIHRLPPHGRGVRARLRRGWPRSGDGAAVVGRRVRLRADPGGSGSASPESATAPTTEDDFDFVGTPQQMVEQMRAFIDLGVDYFIVDCGGFPNLTTLELLINEVLPALND